MKIVKSNGEKSGRKTSPSTGNPEPKGADGARGQPETAQSLRRAIALMRALAKRNEHGARLSDLAADAGLHVATAHRLLSVLADEGLATHDPYSRLYNIGVGMFALGAAAQQFAIRDRLHPLVEEFARETDDVAFLSIRSSYDSLCIDRVEAGNPVPDLTLDIGARRPLGLPAGGTALIAFQHDAEIDNVLTANAERFADYNGLSVEEVQAAVANTRQRGYAINDGRVRPNVRALSVPVRNRRGEVVAALTVAAVAGRMDPERMGDLAARMMSRIAPLAPLLE